MSSRLLLFLASAAIVALLVAFHVLAARLALDWARARSERVVRYLRPVLISLIVFLDLPLAHVLLVYKMYNPPALDELMRSIATPFLLLHVNVTLFGGGALLLRYVVRPLRRRFFGRNANTHTIAYDYTMKTQGSDGMALPLNASLPSAERGGLFGRRKFIRSAALAATGYLASSTALGAMGSTHEHRVEKIVMKIPGLPEPFKGTTIAMITDIHSSVFMNRELMDRYAGEVMKLKADMIFVTGDFVNSKLQEVYPFAESFSALSAPMGVYGVTGNHDYYSGKIEVIAQEVEQSGIRLLRNENLVLERGGAKLWLMGVDDEDLYEVKPYLADGKSRKGTIENMLRGIPDQGVKLFLCHKPYPFEEYSSLGIQAMFSGHTHGGQVVLAHLDNVNLSFASLASKYVAGLYKSRGNRTSQLYVSRGIGTVGIPVRVNCPPEVTHITLV